MALRPSTNITRAATATRFETLLGTYDIDDGGKTSSGVGVNANLGATYRLPLNRGRTLEISGSAAREWYEDAAFRSWSATARAEVVERHPRRVLRYGAYLSRSIFDKHRHDQSRADDWRFGLRGIMSQDFGWGSRTIGLRLEHRDFLDLDARDSNSASLDVGWSRKLSDRGWLSSGVGIERMRPKLPYQRYRGVDLRLGYSHRITDTTRLGAGVSARWRRYDTDFAQLDFPRADDIYRIEFSALDRRLKLGGAMPKLTCAHTRHRSNIALYQTTYTDCGITFSLDF